MELPEVFYKKGVLENFAIFIGKQMCWNLSLKKVCDFIKKRLKHRFFLMNVTEFVRTDFFFLTPLAAVFELLCYSKLLWRRIGNNLINTQYEFPILRILVNLINQLEKWDDLFNEFFEFRIGIVFKYDLFNESFEFQVVFK